MAGTSVTRQATSHGHRGRLSHRDSHRSTSRRQSTYRLMLRLMPLLAANLPLARGRCTTVRNKVLTKFTVLGLERLRRRSDNGKRGAAAPLTVKFKHTLGDK